MTTVQHEGAAQNEQVVAAQQEEKYQAGATEASTQCGGDSICWSWTMKRANEHKADAERHRTLAEMHRSGAKALRDAEAAKCIGIADSDRDMSPFYHREDIISVSKVMKTSPDGRAYSVAKAVFRAVRGLTAERLQHVVDCHIARAVAVGHDMPEMSYCPLMLKDVSATVSSTTDGFAVEVTANDASTAEEVWRRMLALAPPK